MVTKPVLAAHFWPTNGALIADAAKLWIKPSDCVLDPTYGRGLWWTKVRPLDLWTNDLVLGRAQYSYDFRSLPSYWADFFDVVAYDPPYVAVGGRKTTTMPDFHNRYGIDVAPRTPALLQVLMNDGLREMVRVTRPRGLIMVKCQDYISGGKLWNGTYEIQKLAIEELQLEQVDRFDRMQRNPRPQPASNRRQVHARRNLSTLFVFRKARA